MSDPKPLSEKLLKLKQESSGIADNAILQSINIDLMRSFENLEQTNETIKSFLHVANMNLEGLSIGYDPRWETVKQSLFECEVFFKIFPYLKIEKIVEAKGKTSEKRPDFKVKFSGKEIFIECKSFSWESPSLTIKKDQEDSVEMNIQLAKAAKKPGVHSAHRSVSPYDNSKKGSKYFLKPITVIQEKLENNLKADQLNKGNTILFLDLSLLTLPEPPHESINPFSISKNGMGTYAWNSTLWTLCCGKEGMPMFGFAENCPTNENFGYLRYDGIFHKFSNVDAVVFKSHWDHFLHNLVGIERETMNHEFIDYSVFFEMLNIKVNSSERNRTTHWLNV